MKKIKLFIFSTIMLLFMCINLSLIWCDSYEVNFKGVLKDSQKVSDRWKKINHGKSLMPIKVDSDKKDTFVVFWNEKMADETRQRCGFTIFQKDGNSTHIVVSRIIDDRSLGVKSAAIDIDNDGIHEILLIAWIGTSAGFETYLFRLKKDGLTEILPRKQTSSGISVENLDKTPQKEIILYPRFGPGENGLGTVYRFSKESGLLEPDYSADLSDFYKNESKRAYRKIDQAKDPAIKARWLLEVAKIEQQKGKWHLERSQSLVAETINQYGKIEGNTHKNYIKHLETKKKELEKISEALK